MPTDDVSLSADKQDPNSSDSAPVPAFVAQLIELAVVSEFRIRESLAMHWREYLEGEPVNAEREDAIWARLAALLGAVGEPRFGDTVRQACREFFSEVHVLGADDEAKRDLVTIFLYGDTPQRHAAGLLVGRYREDGDRGHRDRRLPEILEQVKLRDQCEIPREIRRQLERIRQDISRI